MTRDGEDHDAHVRMRDWVFARVTVELALRFSNAARDQAKQAEQAMCEARERESAARAELLSINPNDRELLRASRESFDAATRAALRLSIQAGQALEYLMRTTAALEDAIWLCSLTRGSR